MRERYEGYIAGYESCHTRLREFANRIYSILGVKAGNGTEVGRDIDALTKTAQNLSK